MGESIDIHIVKQEQINDRLIDAIESIQDTMSIMSKDMKFISDSQHKQEVLLEKINNTDAKVEDNNKRVHKRIDSIEADFKYKLEKEEKRCKEEISDLKTENIKPINDSLNWAWRFIFTKLVGVVLALGVVIYKLVIEVPVTP